MEKVLTEEVGSAAGAPGKVPPVQPDGQSKKPLEGVVRTAKVLRALEVRGEGSLTEIARDVGLSEPTVLRYLHSLVSENFVERVNDTRYRLGWEIFRMGHRVPSSAVPRGESLPVMTTLLERFNETVNLAIRYGDQVVIVEVLHSSRTVRKLNEIGQIDPWHASALGKAMLSAMSAAERRAILRRGVLRAYTKHTLTDPEAVERDVLAARERGYALDTEEAAEDLTCVAAAVPTQPGLPQMALSVSFLSHRLDEETLDSAGEAVHTASLELARRLRTGT